MLAQIVALPSITSRAGRGYKKPLVYSPIGIPGSLPHGLQSLSASPGISCTLQKLGE